MAERNESTTKTPTNTSGADKNTNERTMAETERNAPGKDRETDREGQQPIGKSHDKETMHGQDDRHQVTNKGTEGNNDERHLQGTKQSGGDASRTEAGHENRTSGRNDDDKKVGGDAARTVAGKDAQATNENKQGQPQAGTDQRTKH
jgi:hypothetical protein